MTVSRARGVKGIISGLTGMAIALSFSLPAFATDHPPLPAEDAQHWALQKEVDNIRIYTMDQPGSGFQAFKAVAEDRKSTRLNSSHVRISYAVFCLKKKKKPADVLSMSPV